MKFLYSCALALVLLSLATAVQAVPPLPSGPLTTTKLEGYCNEHGGTYWPPSADSATWGCILPDGSVIVCGGSVSGCSTIEASSTALPPKLPLSVIDLKIGLETKDDIRVVSDKLELLEQMVIDLGVLVQDECEPPIFVP